MIKITLVTCSVLLVGTSIAVGQRLAPPIDKREACRAAVKSKALRGIDRTDALQICMAEGRLDCVKQAVAQKIASSQRKDFFSSCMGTVKAKNVGKSDDDDK